MIDAGNMIAFGGRDWIILRQWLKEQKDNKVKMLISEESHDKSNKLRGSLAMIDQLLRLENAAAGPQNEE